MIDFCWHIANTFYYKNIPGGRFFEILSMIISSHSVSAEITVGPGTIFYHHGLGCVVLKNTEIGKNCKIFQNVTIGKTFSDNHKKETPRTTRGGVLVGDNVLIGAGAVLLGDIIIGNNVSIGANSVVLDDVPDNAVVAGVPARIKRYKGIV